MAINAKKWIKTKEVQDLLKKPITEIVTKEFFRDPLRRIYYDPTVMYAPADGVVLYAYQCLGPKDPVVEVKGVNFTTQQLINDKNYNGNSLVVGIFMTVADVHVNRMPTNGYFVEENDTPFLFTHNISMYALEQGFFKDLNYNPDNLSYLFKNERKVCCVCSNETKGDYYLVQVADKDINTIVNWGDDNYLMQGERFGQIRWGSQVDLVIPLEDSKVEYEILIKVHDHVKAGIDPIIRIIK